MMYRIINKYDPYLSLDKQDYLIQKYNLKYISKFKMYIIQNIEIISDISIISFYKVKNKKIMNDLEISEVYKSIPFSYFNVDKEEIYKLYKNTINNVDILVKKYDNYITIEYQTEELKNLELIDK